MITSYNEVVNNDGNLDPDKIEALVRGGDVFAVVEQLYGMVWYLAETAAPASPPAMVKAMVEAARRHYDKGLVYAKGTHDQFPDDRKAKP